MCVYYIYIHSLATLLGTRCQYRFGPPFAFRTTLILHGIDSTRCWKHSSEFLVHIDMIASRSCCRFVGCTSMMQISRSITSQKCSIGLRSGDCGGHISKINDKCTAILNIRYWSNYINLKFMPITPQVKLCKPITFHEMVHLTIHLLDS